MGGGTSRNGGHGKAVDRGDSPDDDAFMRDLLASEYGWTDEQIDGLPIDKEAQLFHAILCRKGVKCYRKQIQTEDHDVSLFDRLQESQIEIDTDELEEGITWLLQ